MNPGAILVLCASVAESTRLSAGAHLTTQQDSCLRVADLEVAFRKLSDDMPLAERRRTALEAWCGVSDSLRKVCQVCFGDCLSNKGDEGDLKFYLHWKEEKRHTFRGFAGTGLDMHFGSADLQSGNHCAHFDLLKGNSNLHTLGAVGGQLHGVCAHVKMQMVAHLQIAVVRALGAERVNVRDASYFAPACTAAELPEDRLYFFTWPLKVATKGRTMYQGYYGNSFHFKNNSRNMIRSCQAFADAIRNVVVSEKLQQSFDELLVNLQAVSDTDTTNCMPAMKTYKQLMPHFKKTFQEYDGPTGGVSRGVWPGQLCGMFWVDVASAPACG